MFFSTSDACCKFNDQRIVGAAVESPDERDLAYNDTHFWVRSISVEIRFINVYDINPIPDIFGLLHES